MELKALDGQKGMERCYWGTDAGWCSPRTLQYNAFLVPCFGPSCRAPVSRGNPAANSKSADPKERENTDLNIAQGIASKEDQILVICGHGADHCVPGIPMGTSELSNHAPFFANGPGVDMAARRGGQQNGRSGSLLTGLQEENLGKVPQRGFIVAVL